MVWPVLVDGLEEENLNSKRIMVKIVDYFNLTVDNPVSIFYLMNFNFVSEMAIVVLDISLLHPENKLSVIESIEQQLQHKLVSGVVAEKTLLVLNLPRKVGTWLRVGIKKPIHVAVKSRNLVVLEIDLVV